jgi:hypothetical protein
MSIDKNVPRRIGYISDNLDDYHPVRKHIKILDDRRVISRRKKYTPIKTDRRRADRRNDLLG